MSHEPNQTTLKKVTLMQPSPWIRNFALVLIFLFAASNMCIAQSEVKEAEGSQTKAQSEPKQDKKQWLVFKGEKGIGTGKHIVLIAGDDEYRSEEALPMLGKILARHHGFKCTVLFPINDDGVITPNHQTNIPGMSELKNADLMILGLRFRNLPDEDMKHFVDYVDSGKPIIGIRTTTHAFKIPKDRKYADYSFNAKKWKGGFGQQVLGDTWINHHGHHGKQSTRGVIPESAKDNPIASGVKDVWGPTDVYGIKNLPKEATIILNGSVLDGMKPTDKPVEGEKNNPMMPVAWTLDFKSKSGKSSRVFCTTMGAATDFECEDMRRLLVNASIWGLGMESKMPEKANVDIVGSYKPTNFGFKNFKKGLKPADYDW